MTLALEKFLNERFGTDWNKTVDLTVKVDVLFCFVTIIERRIKEEQIVRPVIEGAIHDWQVWQQKLDDLVHSIKDQVNGCYPDPSKPEDAALFLKARAAELRAEKKFKTGH